MDLTTLPRTHGATIPEDYLDEMGHMNVMWYTYLFGRATGGLFRLFGLDRAYCQANQAGAFALEHHVRYLVEVRTGMAVAVRSRALGRSARRLHFMHFLVIEDAGALATTGEFVAAHIDMTVRRMAPLPAPLADAFDRLLADHDRLDWAPPTCGVMKP